MRFLASRAGLALCVAAGLAFGMLRDRVGAAAQEKYPSRPVRVLVPYAPGGATDIVTRILGDELQKITGQPFVVINKPGAFGMLAIDEMEKAAPDGYTLMVGNVSTNAITPILYAKKMNADYRKSVTAVTNLVDVPAFLLATAANGFPPKTVKEFIDYARKNPGKVRYGTVGIGSYPHYDMAYFAKRAGDLDLAGLPNKNGASGVIQDMLRGDVQAAFLNVASTAGQVKAGSIRALAVVNHTRLAEYPDIPTMQEAGFPGVGTVAWNALFAPAATPRPVLEALYAAASKAMQAPEVVEKLKKQNFNIVPNSSLAEAKIWLDGEMTHWESITQTVKIDVGQ
jgi:tripartite-type tricarboxylate transporter receptor subunit TctC